MNIAYLKVTYGLRFHPFFFGFAYCLCLFTGIVVQQLWSSAFSRKHEVWAPAAGAAAGMVRHLYVFFFATGLVPPRNLVPYANSILCILSFISHRPDHKGTLASDLKGAGARAPKPPLVYATEYTPKGKFPNWAQLAIFSPRCHVTR